MFFSYGVCFRTPPRSHARLDVFMFSFMVHCGETGCFGVEGLEIAAFPGASSAVLGGLRADGHGLSEPGVLLLLSSWWCNCCSWCWWCFHWRWSWYPVSVTVVVCGAVGAVGVAVGFDAAVALAVFVSDMAVAVATTAVHV